MAEETEYGVRLVWYDENQMQAGTFVYRGDQLPEPGQEITVEAALRSERTPTATPVPAASRRARVTEVILGDEFPIRATELAP